MKKLITLIGLLAVVNIHAAINTANGTSLTNTLVNVITNGAKITYLTAANAGTNTVTFALFDAPSTSLTWTNNTWVWTSNYVDNVTNTVVASTGITNTYIYTNMLCSTLVTNAASTNNFYKLGSFSVTAGASLTVPITPFNVFMGLGFTNTSPGAAAGHVLSLTATYGNQY